MNIMLRDKNLSPVESNFDRLLKEFFGPSAFLRDGNEAKPAIELRDDKEKVYLNAELPGVNKDNIDIKIGEDSVSISGEYKNENECKDEEGRVYCSEMSRGNFIRTVPLPESVDYENAEADFKDGILSIEIPKTKTQKDNVKQIKL